jgi:hypothetical protein
MAFCVVEPAQFLPGEVFREDDFLAGLAQFDWSSLTDRMVLVRGCGDIITPPWAFMAIAARLVGVAQSVRYGNEHDNVLVYRRKAEGSRHAESNVSAERD